MSSSLSGRSILSANQKPEHASVSWFPTENTRSRPILKSSLKLPKTLKKGRSYIETFSCECGPDFYNRVLGPTADEAILRGVKAVINVFRKMTVCFDDERSETEETENIGEPSSAKSVKTALEIVSEILQSIGFPSEIAEEIAEESIANLEEQKSDSSSKILQASTPEMVSRILQTSGFSPNLASAIVQTSFANGIAHEGSSLSSAHVQTTEYEAPPKNASMTSKRLQTSSVQVKPEMVQTNPASMVTILPGTEEPSKSKFQEMFMPSKTNEAQQLENNNNQSQISARNNESVLITSKDENMCCPCCGCNQLSDEKGSELKTVSKRIEETERMFSKEMVKICKCAECSALVPVIHHKSKIRQKCTCYPKPKEKCICGNSGKKRSKFNHGSLAKGDMCAAMGSDACYCDSYTIYQY